MKDLCDIYDGFGLEQDAIIIYSSVAKHLVQDKQQVEENKIMIKRKGN